MLQFDSLSTQAPVEWPFRHLTGQGALLESDRQALMGDFPDPRRTGFFDEADLDYGPAFASLIDDLKSDRVAAIVGEKLGVELVGKPRIIVVRKWSAAKDGRPHTDGRDKVATLLVYLNDSWDGDEGQLRMLASNDIEGPGTEPISAAYGSFVAFARSDSSWHGHPPFKGERRVIQTTWLLDEDAARRKDKRHARGRFLKGLWFGKKAA